MSSESSEIPPIEKPPVEVIDATEENSPASPPEATVGTGSYIAVSCTLGMLVLLVILIGVVFLLRWLE